MNISGKTPLFRAHKLEALLGVKKIYLKLEGANPFGHKYDRLTEYLVKDAIFRNKEGILAEGPIPFIQSIIYFANAQNLKVIVPFQTNDKLKNKLTGEYERIDVQELQDSDYRHFIEKTCYDKRYFNGYSGYSNVNTSKLALEGIGDELYDKFGDDIDNIFIQLSYGLTLTGIHNSFERRFIKGISDKTPSIISCTIPNGNVIYEQYRKSFELSQIDDFDNVHVKYSRMLQVNNSELLESALDAIYDTRGRILAIKEAVLLDSAKQLRNKEGIQLSTQESYSMAGLFQMAAKGELKDGIHVVLLNDAKSDIEITHIKRGDFTIDELYNIVDSFLQQYSDPYVEIADALNNAFDKGTIILAKRNGVIQGISVVVHMGFEEFIPTYHLGYIGTKEGNKGRGIATELLDEVINFTKGNVSLHVDVANARAMRVYSKMGFKNSYNRMLYKGNQ